MREKVASSKDEMVALGMPQFTVEDFYENFLDNLDRFTSYDATKSPSSRLQGDDKASLEEVEAMFQDEGTSNYLVVFLRLLTSKQLQLEGDFYQVAFGT